MWNFPAMAGMTPLVPRAVTTGPHTGRAAPTQTFLAKNVTNRGTDLFREPEKDRKNV